MPISFPGYVPDVAPSRPVADDWGNGIRDRSLQVFANLAALNAAIPSPQVGQIAQVNDTGKLLVFNGATVGWTPPWNTSWGTYARRVRESAANTLGNGTPDQITGVNLTAIDILDNRWTRVSLNVPRVVKNTSGWVKIWIRINTTDFRELIFNTNMLDTERAAASGFMELSLAAGTYDFDAATQSSVGTASFDATTQATGDPGAIILTVEDVGPNGNPT